MTTVNKSGLQPRGNKVLIAPDAVETVSEMGIILNTLSKQEQLEMGQTFGYIIAVGDEAWHTNRSAWGAVGERVAFARYAGQPFMGLDNVEYRLINDRDVVAVAEPGVRAGRD